MQERISWIEAKLAQKRQSTSRSSTKHTLPTAQTSQTDQPCVSQTCQNVGHKSSEHLKQLPLVQTSSAATISCSSSTCSNSSKPVKSGISIHVSFTLNDVQLVCL